MPALTEQEKHTLRAIALFVKTRPEILADTWVYPESVLSLLDEIDELKIDRVNIASELARMRMLVNKIT